MNDCPREIDVERLFDGATAGAAEVRAHLDACPACRAHLVGLERMRSVFAARKAAPEIADAQLPAFLRQLQDRVETAPAAAQPYRIWAAFSAVAAAFVVTVSIVSVFSAGPKQIEATVIEERSSEILGATTDVSVSGGTTTVWVHVPEGDMW